MMGPPKVNASEEAPAVIVLFGPTGSGKSSFANLASGKDEMVVGHGVQSCTKDVKQTSIFHVDKRPVVLVDCPGFSDTLLTDATILDRISGYLANVYSLGFKITGLLYFHPINHTRFDGASRSNFRMFRKLCGTESLQNVVVVTNMWSKPPKAIEVDREAELKISDECFQPVIQEGAQMSRHEEQTQKSAHDIIRLVLGKAPSVPKVASQTVDEKRDLKDTDAGRSLGESLAEALKRCQDEITKLKAQHAEALKEKDEKWRSELDQEMKKAQERNRSLEEENDRLKRGDPTEKIHQQDLFNAMIAMQKSHIEMMNQYVDWMKTNAEEERKKRQENDGAEEERKKKQENGGTCVIF